MTQFTHAPSFAGWLQSRGKSLENEKVSRSGKSQGISLSVSEI